MSAKVRNSKTKSSLTYCEEKFSCQGENIEAEYECEQCKSYQCNACESSLHSLAKFVFHDRKRLQPAPAELLCQYSCENRNYSNIACTQCELKYCSQCFNKMHSSGKRKLHTKVYLDHGLINVNESSCTSTGPAQLIVTKSITNTTPSLSSLENNSSDFVSLGDRDHLDAEEKPSGTMMQHSNGSLPDVAQDVSPVLDKSPIINIDSVTVNDEVYKNRTSILLIDNEECLQVNEEKKFIQALGCDNDSMVKVVSIFGNTGDGKSHTLNHTFFEGKEVFKTSAAQTSCTAGVWASYDPVHRIILLDTEGLLGVTSNENQRTRLLLKVLAISDVVIYRTQADRLHNDMFYFLGDASKAYIKHFSTELKAALKRGKMDIPLSNLGPAVVIFHETRHTDPLLQDEGPEVQLRRRCSELDIDLDAFSALQYVGIKTVAPPTSFKSLQMTIKSQLRNTNVRSHRKPAVVYAAIKVLNDKFSGDIEKSMPSTFPDQYFTCASLCLSCSTRCTNTMNHAKEGITHSATERRCKYQHQYENKVFHCKACYDRGQDIVVVPKTSESSESSWLGLAKYAWSGYVLECPYCGIIFRSRQYWYGNQDPEKSVVRTEIRHVWSDGNPVLQGTHNAARRLLDSISHASDTISSISAKPVKFVGKWMTDQIAPDYWVPNAKITHCKACSVIFNENIRIHHCRSCGQGFCDECSSKNKPVPERGWGMEPVRVCDSCYAKDTGATSMSDQTQVRVRKIGEVIGTTLGTVSSVITYPRDVILESARPAYWVPDQDITECKVCSIQFTEKLLKHHCRSCGNGVCDDCSLARRAVPSRGWDYPVRVCNTCDKKKDTL